MVMNALSFPSRPAPMLAAAFLSVALTGCYTQLYSRGYAARAAENYPDYDRSAAAGSQADDSAAAGPADSAQPAPTVIVNEYYGDRPYYRGYPEDAWAYPYVSFGWYSSGYRDFYGAYWWDDPRYYRHGRPYYGGRRRYDDRDYRPSAGGGSPGPYKSDKRLFTPAPERTPKGRRSAQPIPAPKASADAKAGDGSSGSGTVSPPQSPPEPDKDKDEGKDDDAHPALKKGRRR
jgi:hypothetical protein